MPVQLFLSIIELLFIVLGLTISYLVGLNIGYNRGHKVGFKQGWEARGIQVPKGPYSLKPWEEREAR